MSGVPRIDRPRPFLLESYVTARSRTTDRGGPWSPAPRTNDRLYARSVDRVLEIDPDVVLDPANPNRREPRP